MEERISSARLFPIQPRRNRYVLRLYNCIGTQRLASVARNLVVHRTSCVTSHPSLLAHKNPSSLDRAGGAREAAGSDSAPREENFTITARIGARY
jgi:hypothetical protein